MRGRRTITWAVAAVVVCVLAGVVFAAARRHSVSAGADEAPTTRVQRGDLEMGVYATGEFRASHSEPMMAPPIGGGALEITHLLHTGTAVNKGDLVMEFDPTE